MRVLHLTPELPCWPGGTGGATRQFHLLRRLVELGHAVTVVAPVAPAQQAALEGLRAAGVEAVAVERPASRPLEAVAALRRRPTLAPLAMRLPVLAWQVSVFWATLQPVAQALLAERGPHLLSVEHDNAAAWAADLHGAPPAVLTLQNVGWHYYANRAAAVHGPRRTLFEAEARRFRRHNLRHFRSYARIVTVSERDRADVVVGGARQPVDVVPNGVDTRELVPILEPGGSPVLIFTGTLNHPPNAEGVAWFADEVWPAVLSARPDARLMVVGREPPAAVLRLGSRPRIDVVGPVEDMRDWYRRATAVVVPLLSGGGSRLKILEGIACGRAVVSTSAGAEGLELEDGRELLIADGAEAFTAATLRLLAEPRLRAALAGGGRRAAEERYDWRVLGDRLAEVFAGAAS